MISNNFYLTKDGKLHPFIALILANIIIAIFLRQVFYFSTDTLQTYILGIIVIIFGGYTAIYFSGSDKAIIGLYNSLLFLVLSLLVIIFVFKTELTLNIMLFLFIILPISGFIGGYIGKLLRKYLAN